MSAVLITYDESKTAPKAIFKLITKNYESRAVGISETPTEVPKKVTKGVPADAPVLVVEMSVNFDVSRRCLYSPSCLPISPAASISSCSQIPTGGRRTQARAAMEWT